MRPPPPDSSSATPSTSKALNFDVAQNTHTIDATSRLRFVTHTQDATGNTLRGRMRQLSKAGNQSSNDSGPL